jgi:hypothetical protein
MTEEERQARMAELKKVPKSVQSAVLLVFPLGLITLVRMPVAAYVSHLSVGRALLYGLMAMVTFGVCGVSLYTRSRFAYVFMVMFSLLPFPGLFGVVFQSIQIMLNGTLEANGPQAIHGLMALVQLIITCYMFRYLLAKPTRDFIWKPSAGTGQSR